METVSAELGMVLVAITLAWLAGFRVYLTAFALGLAGAVGWSELPPALQVLQSPWVLLLSGALTLAEFSADKIQGVDSLSDLVNTLVRVPGGAFLAAGAMAPEAGELSGAWLGGGAALALLAHALKSGTRVAVNASPEPFSNVLNSGVEDVGAASALLLVLSYPWLALLIALSVPIGLALFVAWVVRRLGGSGRPAQVADAR